MIFKCEMVEARSEDGVLDGIGVRWTEARPLCEAAIHKLAEVTFLVAFFLGFGGVALAAAVGTPFVVAVIVVVCLLGTLSWKLFLLGWRVPGRVREVTFWHDGIMRAPFGLSTANLKNNESQLPLASIESIEAEQLIPPKGENCTIYTHGVRVFYGSGHINHIAQYLAPDHAHMLAVNLTQALAELRKEIPSLSPTGIRRSGPASEEAQLID